MILYHGSNVVIKNPISTKGRSDVDFGAGFYLTADKNMARKWASNKNQSIVNVYEVDLSMLQERRRHEDTFNLSSKDQDIQSYLLRDCRSLSSCRGLSDQYLPE